MKKFIQLGFFKNKKVYRIKKIARDKWLGEPCPICGAERIYTRRIAARRSCERPCFSCTRRIVTRSLKLPGNQAAFNHLFVLYRRGAKRRNLKFEIDESQFAYLIVQPCVYCGSSNGNCTRVRGEEFYYTGIDRINNKIDYVMNNVAPCCQNCNRAKYDMTTREYAKHVCATAGVPERSEICWNEWAVNIRNISREILNIQEMGEPIMLICIDEDTDAHDDGKQIDAG